MTSANLPRAPFSTSWSAPFLVASFEEPQNMLSWSLTRPGFVTARSVVWLEVRDDDLPLGVDPVDFLRRRASEAGHGDAVHLMTSRAVKHRHTGRSTVGGSHRGALDRHAGPYRRGHGSRPRAQWPCRDGNRDRLHRRRIAMRRARPALCGTSYRYRHVSGSGCLPGGHGRRARVDGRILPLTRGETSSSPEHDVTGVKPPPIPFPRHDRYDPGSARRARLPPFLDRRECRRPRPAPAR